MLVQFQIGVYPQDLVSLCFSFSACCFLLTFLIYLINLFTCLCFQRFQKCVWTLKKDTMLVMTSVIRDWYIHTAFIHCTCALPCSPPSPQKNLSSIIHPHVQSLYLTFSSLKQKIKYFDCFGVLQLWNDLRGYK